MKISILFGCYYAYILIDLHRIQIHVIAIQEHLKLGNVSFLTESCLKREQYVHSVVLQRGRTWPVFYARIN